MYLYAVARARATSRVKKRYRALTRCLCMFELSPTDISDIAASYRLAIEMCKCYLHLINCRRVYCEEKKRVKWLPFRINVVAEHLVSFKANSMVAEKS